MLDGQVGTISVFPLSDVSAWTTLKPDLCAKDVFGTQSLSFNGNRGQSRNDTDPKLLKAEKKATILPPAQSA